VLGQRTAPVITFTAPAILVQLVDLVCMLLLDAVTMVSSITPVSAVGHVWRKVVLESNVRFRYPGAECGQGVNHAQTSRWS